MSRACFSQAVLRANVGTSMIWKTGSRFSEKIMLKAKTANEELVFNNRGGTG
jgi:hypothetical protein